MTVDQINLQNVDEYLIDFNHYAVAYTMDRLLIDKTTKKNIIWATDTYESMGNGFGAHDGMLKRYFYGSRAIHFQPRTVKSEETKKARTKAKAEVFTPAWLCNKMNNYLDEDWFGRKDVFNVELEHDWKINEGKIQFPDNKGWKEYVDSTRMEITCGEAPFLVSRYDASTGDFIVPVLRRIGLLDRKLRVVDENTNTEKDWLKWAERAVQSCYGYEYQGDNLLLARINILLTYVEYYQDRWKKDPDKKTLLKIANIIAWNIWQMDGLKGTIPFGSLAHEHRQMTIFDMMEDQPEKDEEIPCRIYDWRANRSIPYISLKKNRERE